jgi:hypothetical protein
VGAESAETIPSVADFKVFAFMFINRSLTAIQFTSAY